MTLYALDLASGKEKWKYKAVPFKAPASVHDGAVYVGDSDGIFHCVDAATGAKRWTFKTESEISGGAKSQYAGRIVRAEAIGRKVPIAESVRGPTNWESRR